MSYWHVTLCSCYAFPAVIHMDVPLAKERGMHADSEQRIKGGKKKHGSK